MTSVVDHDFNPIHFDQWPTTPIYVHDRRAVDREYDRRKRVVFAERAGIEASPGKPLGGVGLAGLVSLYREYHAAHDGLQGVYNQPRTKGEAWNGIETEIERCTDIMQAIATEAGARRPTSRDEHELRAEILVLWGVICGDWREVMTSSRGALSPAGFDWRAGG
jgi:hypothetical protein